MDALPCRLSSLRFFSRGQHTVAVTGWLRNDDKFNISMRFVAHLVGHACGDFDALLRLKHFALSVDLQGGSAGKHEKELPSGLMVMPGFGRSWWHAFMDDADLAALDEMP